MIAPSGYTSLFHLTRELMDKAGVELSSRISRKNWTSMVAEQSDDGNYDDLPRYISSYQEMAKEIRTDSASRKLWAYLKETDDACVFPNGQEPFFVSRYAFKPDEPFRTRGLYVDLLVGTIGSGLAFGKFRKADEKKLVTSADEQHPYFFTSELASVLHLPICLPTPVADGLLTDADAPEVTNAATLSDAEIVQLIVRKFDDGYPVTKDWVRNGPCAGMKHVVFLALWKAATTKRPELSKPGPRSL